MSDWRQNIRVYTITTFFQWFYVVIGVWVIIWRSYLSWEQIGFVTAIGLAVQLLLELPSGAMADLVGRKATVLFGRFLGVIGFAILIFADNFWMFVLGNSLYLANWAFESGALSALVYDSLKENGKEQEYYQKTEANAFFYATIGMAISSVVGGMLYSYNHMLPYIATTFAAVLALVTALFLDEPKIVSTKFSIKQYIQQNIEGVKHIFREPKIRAISIFSILIDFVAYVGLWYLYEPRLSEAGFPAEMMGLLVAGTYIARAVGTKAIGVISKHIKDSDIPVFITLLQSFTSFISFVETKSGAILSVYSRKFSDGIRTPILNRFQNNEIESTFRATSLSAISMFSNVLIAATGMFVGELIQNFSVAQVLGSMGFFGIIVVLPISILLKTRLKINYNQNVS